MMLLAQLRCFKTIRKPGKSGPAVFAFSDPRPLLQDFTKNIDAKAKPSLHKPRGSRAEGFTKPMSSEPAPSHRPWISALGATPARRALPYHAGLQSYSRRTGFFFKLKVRSCRMRTLSSTTTLVRPNGCKKTQTRGCCRSTELLIVVPRPTWRNIFRQKTWHRQRKHQGDTRRSFGQ